MNKHTTKPWHTATVAIAVQSVLGAACAGTEASPENSLVVLRGHKTGPSAWFGTKSGGEGSRLAGRSLRRSLVAVICVVMLLLASTGVADAQRIDPSPGRFDCDFDHGWVVGAKGVTVTTPAIVMERIIVWASETGFHVSDYQRMPGHVDSEPNDHGLGQPRGPGSTAVAVYLQWAILTDNGWIAIGRWLPAMSGGYWCDPMRSFPGVVTYE